MDALLRICVRFRASMLLLVTRLSNCSARSSVDSFSSWIILKENKVFHPAPLFFLMSTTCNFLAHYGEIDKRMKTLPQGMCAACFYLKQAGTLHKNKCLAAQVTCPYIIFQCGLITLRQLDCTDSLHPLRRFCPSPLVILHPQRECNNSVLLHPLCITETTIFCLYYSQTFLERQDQG